MTRINSLREKKSALLLLLLLLMMMMFLLLLKSTTRAVVRPYCLCFSYSHGHERLSTTTRLALSHLSPPLYNLPVSPSLYQLLLFLALSISLIPFSLSFHYTSSYWFSVSFHHSLTFRYPTSSYLLIYFPLLLSPIFFLFHHLTVLFPCYLFFNYFFRIIRIVVQTFFLS